MVEPSTPQAPPPPAPRSDGGWGAPSEAPPPGAPRAAFVGWLLMVMAFVLVAAWIVDAPKDEEQARAQPVAKVPAAWRTEPRRAAGGAPSASEVRTSATPSRSCVMREGPSTAHPRLATVMPGELCRVRTVEGGWRQVSCGDRVGWLGPACYRD